MSVRSQFVLNRAFFSWFDQVFTKLNNVDNIFYHSFFNSIS